MDKQSKFKLLQRIALTREEADEYFENYAEEKKKKCEIFLPFSIVYETEKNTLMCCLIWICLKRIKFGVFHFTAC